MKKTTDDRNVGGDSEADPSELSVALPFRILVFSTVAYGRKRGVGRIEVDGFGCADFDLFARDDGSFFVTGGSTRDSYTGRWQRHITFSDVFASELLAAIVARLDAEEHAE